MTPFSTFSLLYMTAVVLDIGEVWSTPWVAATIPILAVAALTRVTRFLFLLFLAVSCAEILARFPDVANHVNLVLYLNAVIALGIVYTWMRPRVFPTVDDAYDVIRPLVQGAAIVMYAMAGFHKLNVDFFNPDVSCARPFAGRLLHAMRSTTVSLLMVAGLATVSAIVWWKARGPRLARIAIVGAGLVAILAVILVGSSTDVGSAARAMPRPVVLVTAFFIVGWELIGGLMLAIPSLQAPVVALSWLMHASLSLVGFVDFGALALAILFTFVPAAQFELLNRPVRLPLVGLAVHRVQVYVFICVLMTLLRAVPYARDVLEIRLHAGLVFNAAAWFLLWPLVACLWRSCAPWRGVPVIGGTWAAEAPQARRRAPRWVLVPTALLVLFGLTGYLGLRTTGNFSMFSNLRTEGERSNHLLLGSNPLKLWGYQDDAVHVIAIDDQRAWIGNHYGPMLNMQLPITEFRKRIRLWTKAGRTVPITFRYRGATYASEDIANDPVWRTTERTWPMRLMDFREIQPQGPNACRW